VADLLEARAADGTLPRAVLPDLARLCDAHDAPRPAALGELQQLVDGFEGLTEAPLPEDLTATLRSYQRQGVDWLCFMRDAGLGALLADDMGLGKTLQTLAVVRGRTLVVCADQRAALVAGRGRAVSARAQPASTTGRTGRSARTRISC
jgi:hypothetical protein